ncbi:MAG: tyrosine-type recombinase/integrase [Xanthomonadales bacterium]|nr:tyrosine-type recombinase/integrase [Xanthomonadales bacterium]
MAEALLARRHAKELEARGVSPTEPTSGDDYTFAAMIADDLEERIAAGKMTDAQAQGFYRVATCGGELLAEVAEEWLAAFKRMPGTVEDYRRAVQLLIKFMGGDGVLVQDVTHDRAADYVASVKRLGLSKVSKEKRVHPLGGLWGWLAECRRFPREISNPWHGFSFEGLATNREPEEPKRGYRDDELLRVLSRKPTYRALDEVIVLAMWTGARIDELCSLRRRDVSDRGDAMLLQVARVVRGKGGKSKAATRTVVVVHGLPCSVLRARVAQQADGAGLLFPEFVPGGPGAGKQSWHVSKAFGRHRDGVGLTRATDFHSFRRTVATKLDNEDLADDVIARMLGHETGVMVRDLYSDGPKVERLMGYAKRIAYPDDIVAAAQRMLMVEVRQGA